uniref:PNT domain-containing protein n=1 Tax=Rhodnius prolixus TaxID=13249 RepID=T1I9I4_RHOPR
MNRVFEEMGIPIAENNFQKKLQDDLAFAHRFMFADPSKWTAEEVETWLAWNLAQYSLPSTTAQYFQMPGHSLVTLSEQDFQQRAPEGGSLLHAQLELWKAASMDETTVDVSGLLHETTTTRSGSSSGEPSDDNIKFAIYSICAFGSTKAVIIPRKKMSYLLKQPGCSTG